MLHAIILPYYTYCKDLQPCFTFVQVAYCLLHPVPTCTDAGPDILPLLLIVLIIRKYEAVRICAY